jgi:hypothetical protein
MPAKINWNNQNTPQTLNFDQLSYGDCYKVATSRSKGAVYMKTEGGHQDYALELATGKLFPPQLSPLSLVEVEINIQADKPTIY